MRGTGSWRTRLESVRGGGATHHALQTLGALIGIGLATVHWSGFLVGGALVGVLAASVRRAVLGGVAVGLLGWAAFAGLLLVDGTLGAYLAAGQPLAVSLLVGPLLGGIGALARGIV